MKQWLTMLAVFLVVALYWGYTMAAAIYLLDGIGIPHPITLFLSVFAPFVPPIVSVVVLDWLYEKSLPNDRII